MGGFERKPGGSSLVHDTYGGSSQRGAPLGPGKRTLVEQLEPVQRRAMLNSPAPTSDDVQTAAEHGTSGAAGALPHLDTIQRFFGAHDVSGVKAHTDGAAAAGAAAMGAQAFASGDHVAFARAPDLHTAAHEAAHVVQQRGGVQLKDGVGEVGDRYEQHADAVAARVVAGQSSEDLLNELTPGPPVDPRAMPAGAKVSAPALGGGEPLAAKLVQRDTQSFTPAPAPGVFPPSPPVPGSAGAVKAEAFEIGRASGSVLADIDSALGEMMRDRAGVRIWDRMSAEDKATFAKESAARFDKLPQLRRVDEPELAAAQEDGFNAGVAQGYETGRIATFLVNLGTEVALILITSIAAGTLLPRLLMRILGRGATVVFGGAGDTITLYRYAKIAGDVEPSGWWTTRQAASRAEAARLTGVPESECLFEQRVTVNAAPSKYEPFFESKTARAVGDSLVEEFKNKVLIPRTAMQVRPMPE